MTSEVPLTGWNDNLEPLKSVIIRGVQRRAKAGRRPPPQRFFRWLAARSDPRLARDFDDLYWDAQRAWHMTRFPRQ